MADKSKIEWTDATVNFWWGCTKVGPGCDHCYAETLSSRFDKTSLWGVGAPRRKIQGAAALMEKLNRQALAWQAEHLRLRNVFIQSMSDLFDLEAPLEWFAEAWSAIKRCDLLAIQIVTKRVSVVAKRLAAIGETAWPVHVQLLVSVTDQAEADRDVPRLLALKAKFGIRIVGISAEPLLGPIDFRRLATGERTWLDALTGYQAAQSLTMAEAGTMNALLSSIPSYPLGLGKLQGLDWIIVGGESGPGARDNGFIENARAIRDQCKAVRVPFFGKQNVKKADLPTDLMVREFPHRLLDGAKHNALPRAAQ